MIRLEMRNSTIHSIATKRLEHDRFERSGTPSEAERRFACQLAASVWLAQLGDEAARAALAAYVMARCHNRWAQACLRVALLTEYRLCRERLELCS